jgi:hypothetical protein
MWLALGLNVLGGILAGLAFSGWAWVRRELSASQFKQVFGPGVASPNFALVYAELELGDRTQAHPFRKAGGNREMRFSIDRPVSSCEVRALNYLASTIGRFVGATPSLRSDLETLAVLNLDFVSLGGPGSNSKSADCQSNSANRLAVFDQPSNQFSDPTTGRPPVTFKPGFDYGLILKVRPSQFPDRVWFAAAGIGEWGTSGAGWFLANKWQEIRRRAGGRAFAGVVRVLPGQDESAEIVRLVVAPS